MTARDRVLATLPELSADELEVLAQVAEGLNRGRKVYGELRLDTDPRDMTREALEEVRDALVYAGGALVRLQRAASDAQIAQEPRTPPPGAGTASAPDGSTGSSACRAIEGPGKDNRGARGPR